VKGAASNPGMGWSIAHLFVREGANVLCGDVDGNGMGICPASIREAGGSAAGAHLDVTSSSN